MSTPQDNLPGVSVLMPTYARTKVLGEAIYGFLQQTYRGPTELIVFNDCQDQTLVCDAPRVNLVNFSTRYAGLGDKRASLMSAAKHELVCFWDDDDIYLPERIERGVQLYLARKPQGYRVSRESHAFQTEDNEKLTVRDAGPMWCVLSERSAIVEVGGPRNVELNYDVDLVTRLNAKKFMYGESATPGMPSFIYRHGNATPYHHMTGLATDAETASVIVGTRIHTAMGDATSALLALGAEPTGTIVINPAWNKDYVALAAAVWAQRG